MLDREGPTPVYRQIAQIIHDRINARSLLPGDPVPSESAMESEFGVARTTARRVARELRARGLVHTIQGEGSFVGEHRLPRRRTQVSRYEQIAREVAARIRQGELLPNRAIPSEKDLMRQYGVAKATVRHAVALLREQGWIFTVPYRGSYVSPREGWPSGEE